MQTNNGCQLLGSYWWWTDGQWLLSEYRVSFCSDDHFWTRQRWWLPHILTVLSLIELYTLKWLISYCDNHLTIYTSSESSCAHLKCVQCCIYINKAGKTRKYLILCYVNFFSIKNTLLQTSLVALWLRTTLQCRGLGSIPDQGTKIPHAKE